MDYHSNHSLYVRRSIAKERSPAVRWVREWVPQEVGATGKRCHLLKWVREDMLKVLKEKFKEPEPEEPKPEPTTEILFLCCYEGCNKAYPNEGAYRKHAHVHGERQYACSFPGCGKKFLDSSKLKRHQVVHTGEKNFVCPHEGCGKAFNLDFNLRAHMKTHSQEHYHLCPYQGCGKRYTQECKLKSHIKAQHDKLIQVNVDQDSANLGQNLLVSVRKNTTVDMVKHTLPSEKLHSAPVKMTPTTIYGSPSSDRPYVCPYEGCGKDYIHEYKLNLHLKTQHPGHNPEDSSKNEASDQDVYIAKASGFSKNTKQNKINMVHKMAPAKLTHHKSSPYTPVNVSVNRQQWLSQEMYEDDSEETEEERDNMEDDSDDEETEDED